MSTIWFPATLQVSLGEWSERLTSTQRILVYVALAVLAHLVVRLVRRVGEWVLTPASSPGPLAHELFARRRPKVASVTTLVVSALTFLIYFAAIGLILAEMGVNLAAYLATASVVGLAVAFGMQGLVQDVVIGITLIFTDAFDVGDVVEMSGQVGRVEKIGLRFTQLTNFHGQAVFVPNRSIAMVARYRRGAVRAYVDVQLTDALDETRVRQLVERLASGMRAQYGAILLRDPEVLGVQQAGEGGWRYVRVKFRLWPGQGALIETTYRQRLIAALRELDPAVQDWMVTVIYRAE